MKTKFSLALVAALFCVACNKEENHVHAPGDGHDHPAGAGKEHGAEAGHEHPHGDRTPLGDVTVGGHTISVFQLVAIEPGKEADFDLDFAAGKPMPATVRGWIGLESAQGSMKVRFEKETASRMHGHPVVPKPIPEGSAVWIEIETAAGTSIASMAFRP